MSAVLELDNVDLRHMFDWWGRWSDGVKPNEEVTMSKNGRSSTLALFFVGIGGSSKAKQQQLGRNLPQAIWTRFCSLLSTK